MAKRWWKSGQLKPGQEVKEPGSVLRYDSKWHIKLVINGFGAICTAVVMIVFAITKFKDGAWIVLGLTPSLVAIFFAIHHHYKALARQLSLDNYNPRLPASRHRVFLPFASVHRGTLDALSYACSLSDDVTAIHVSVDQDNAEKIKQKWDYWGNGVRLVVLNSPYRLLIEPLLEYVEKIVAHRQPGEVITIVVPQFVPRVAWHNLLHTQTAFLLRMALLFKPGIVIVEVPYQVQ